jgi:hypothetical protein
MSESNIDKSRRIRYDPAFDAILPVEKSIQLCKDRICWERKRWHWEHDAPPEGYGLDGYPLQRGKRNK